MLVRQLHRHSRYLGSLALIVFANIKVCRSDLIFRQKRFVLKINNPDCELLKQPINFRLLRFALFEKPSSYQDVFVSIEFFVRLNRGFQGDCRAGNNHSTNKAHAKCHGEYIRQGILIFGCGFFRIRILL